MVVKYDSKFDELSITIDEMKQALIEHALKHGFTNPTTVQLSQQLDTLLNKVQFMVR